MTRSNLESGLLREVQDAPVEFRTSLYGRFGYLVMSGIGLFILAFCLMPFLELGPGALAGKPLLVQIFVLLFVFMGAFWFLYCMFFMLWPGWRVRCAGEGMKFLWLGGLGELKWSEVLSFQFNHRADALVFLELRVSGRKRAYRVDVSGLKPTYQKLHSLIEASTGKRDVA